MLDHVDDLRADFLAIYGIADMESLPGPLFCSLAWRVGAYPGVMQELIRREQEQSEKTPGGQRREMVSNDAAAELAGAGYFERVGG